jgi:hypothetical protein
MDASSLKCSVRCRSGRQSTSPQHRYGALAFAVLLDGQLGFALEVSYFAIMRDKPPQRRFVAVRNVTCRDTLGGADWRGAPPTERI